MVFISLVDYDDYEKEDFEQEKDASIQYESQEHSPPKPTLKKATPKLMETADPIQPYEKPNKPTPEKPLQKEEAIAKNKKIITDLKKEEEKLINIKKQVEAKMKAEESQLDSQQEEKDDSSLNTKPQPVKLEEDKYYSYLEGNILKGSDNKTLSSKMS